MRIETRKHHRMGNSVMPRHDPTSPLPTQVNKQTSCAFFFKKNTSKRQKFSLKVFQDADPLLPFAPPCLLHTRGLDNTAAHIDGSAPVLQRRLLTTMLKSGSVLAPLTVERSAERKRTLNLAKKVTAFHCTSTWHYKTTGRRTRNRTCRRRSWLVCERILSLTDGCVCRVGYKSWLLSVCGYPDPQPSSSPPEH